MSLQIQVSLFDVSHFPPPAATGNFLEGKIAKLLKRSWSRAECPFPIASRNKCVWLTAVKRTQTFK